MKQQINLYPRIEAPRVSWPSLVRTAQAAVALLALLLLVSLLLRGAVSWRERALAAEQARLEDLRRQVEAKQAAASRSPSALLAQKVAQLTQQRGRQEQMLGLLTQADGGEGFSPRLDALARQTVSGVWLSQVRLDGPAGGMGLEGLALQADRIPRYLQGLSAQAPLRGVEFRAVRLERLDGPAPYRFTVDSLPQEVKP